MTTIEVESRVLRAAVEKALTSAGYSVEDSEILVDHILAAEASGYASHGLRRLSSILANATTAANSKGSVVDGAASTSARYEANGQQGIVAMFRASQLAVEAVHAKGVAAVAVTGYIGTTGEVGAYTRFLSRHDVVAIIVANSEYAVAPYGGTRAILGTNPIAVGFPAQDFSFSADLATSAWSYGRIKDAQSRNEPLPIGVVQDETGAASSDPADADNGSQLPMAGHKGYALGLAVELLAGPLVGAKAGRNAVSGTDGALIVGLAVDLFRSKDAVESDAAALFNELRSSPVPHGADPVRIPGENHSESLPDSISVLRETLEVAGLWDSLGV
jgi:LDH2 family malate/lactate/ureidoglycolate dehydrogenase